MKTQIIFLLAALAVSTSSAVKLADVKTKKDPTTGKPIPICNGANERFGGDCVTAEAATTYAKPEHGYKSDFEWTNDSSIYSGTQEPHGFAQKK